MTLPVLRTAVPGPRSLAMARELHLWESANVTYIDPEGRFPVFWDSARDCLVTDVDGNSFLDLTAAFGVMSVGHSNPRVVAAIREQAGRLIHGMGDVHPPAIKVELARRIAQRTPGDLGHCIFGSDGADAVEAALKTARLASGRPGVLAFTGGYHGLTYGALAATARADFRAPFADQLGSFVRHVPYPDHEDVLCLDPVADALSHPEIGAVIVEPLQGRGGIIEPPRGWLRALRDLCDERGVLLIVDEIFTGWGRTGDWFACDAEGVVPDILCIGKAMGGGFPISACVARPHIMSCWGESQGEALHTSTFIGSPLGCASALAAIAEIEERNLPARARSVGSYFRECLLNLQQRWPGAVTDVRGRGLMLGIQLRTAEMSLAMVNDLLARGLIVLPAGAGDVLEFVPPLTISEEQIDWAVARIHESIAGLAGSLG